MQQRGVRANLIKNKSKGKVGRSKSKSRSPSPQRKQPNKNNKKAPKTSRDKNKRNRSPSIARSRSKSPKKLGKSASNKKIRQKSSSLPRLGKSADKKNNQISRKNSGKNNSILRSPDRKIGKQSLQNSRKNQPIIKQQEKDMGLIYHQPEHEKILLKVIDALDSVHEKFLQMISNDNDASYVMNALPQFRDIRKEDDSSGRDFISGKITRLSGIFENLNVEKILGPMKKVPMYYTGPCGKNIAVLKIGLQTKFKVQVDLGFLQYSLDGDKITVFRIYISKIYRRMNYIAFSYLQALKLLMEKHPAADRWGIFVLERNQNVHKFFKFLGLKIDKIITDSKVKNQVDYYQEFTIKKRDLQTAISAFK